MKKRKILQYILSTIIIVAVAWTALTFYVEFTGPSKQWDLGNSGRKKVLIVFDPDPFYNLDEQVCLSFARALAEKEMSIKITTVAAADGIDPNDYEVFVYCANTYNWRPDWAITRFIKDQKTDKPNQLTVAITLGAGSTKSSQRNLENIITNSGSKLIASYSLWLWRPNNEEKMEQPNVEIAVAMAYDWGKQIAAQIDKK